MKYINKRTGNVIDVPCRIDGPDWEEMKGAKEKAKPEAAPVDKNAAKRTAKPKAAK